MAYKWDNAWVKVPAHKINEGVLRNFSTDVMGSSIAALKVYIALLEQANNDSKSVDFSYSNCSVATLEVLTGLSRALIVDGIKMLECHKLINVEKAKGKVNRYRIEDYSTTPWGKIPKSRFTNTLKEIGGKTLHDFRCRGKMNLNALKIYLYLVISVDRNTARARRKYDTIEAKTGVRRNDIRQAISLLFEFNLVGVYRDSPEEGVRVNSPNSYLIRDIQTTENGLSEDNGS